MPSVLVIDDEADVRDSLKLVLGRSGFDVRTASHGDEGVASFVRTPADVVIVDVVMPGKNGVEVIATLRARYPSARIVAITGGGGFGPPGRQPDATDAQLTAARRAGADAVLTKPFHRAEVLATVRTLIGG